jgi:hypothetical protein
VFQEADEQPRPHRLSRNWTEYASLAEGGVADQAAALREQRLPLFRSSWQNF